MCDDKENVVTNVTREKVERMNLPRLPENEKSIEILAKHFEDAIEGERLRMKVDGLNIVGANVYLNEALQSVRGAKSWLTEYIKMRDVAIEEKKEREKREKSPGYNKFKGK